MLIRCVQCFRIREAPFTILEFCCEVRSLVRMLDEEENRIIYKSYI